MKNNRITIDFICKCGVPTFRSIYNCCNSSGMKCPECIKMDTQLKRRTTISEVDQPGTAIPTPDRMLEIATERDGFIITTPPPRVFNRDYKVQFTCSCGTTKYNKGVRDIYDHGGFCIQCANKTKGERTDATCMKHFGETRPAKNKDVVAKMIARKEETGNTRSNPEFQKKCEDAFEAKHGPGIRSSFQLEATKDTIVSFWQKNYGVNNPNQVAEILERGQRSKWIRKPFTFKTGETVYVLGFEHYALEMLESEEGLGYNDILTNLGDVPKIMYDFEGSEHRYFVDIYIRSQDRMIEVKSTHTLDMESEKNRAKMAACIDHGHHKVELWVIGERQKDGEKIGTIIEKYINDFTWTCKT